MARQITGKDYRVVLANDLFSRRNDVYLEIGRTTPWEENTEVQDEVVPDLTGNETEVQELFGSVQLTTIANTEIRYAKLGDTAGVDEEVKVVNGISYVIRTDDTQPTNDFHIIYISTQISQTDFPVGQGEVVYYRQIALNLNQDTIIKLENRVPTPRQETGFESVDYIINFA